MKKLLLLLSATLTITACSSGGGGKFAPDTFSAADMCIVKVDNEKEKICYGMERSEAEKIAGDGEENKLKVVQYEFGLGLQYREDKVAGIQLTQESSGVFKTARGSEAGSLKTDIMGLYGEKYAFNEREQNLDYYYDSKEEKLLDEASVKQQTDREAMQDTYVLSVMFDNDGKAKAIMLLDRKMAITYQ